MMGLVALQVGEETPELLLSVIRDIARRQPSASQEEGPHQELNLLGLEYRTSQPLEM